jgi:GAF domain-containing protein/HAMP domain-containing protein
MKIRLSIQQRLFAAFVGLSLLVVLASAAGFIYARSVNNAVAATKTGVELVEAVINIQRDWQSVSGSIDNLFLTRQIESSRSNLAVQLETFNDHLRALETQSLGYRAETITENQTTLRKIRADYLDTSDTIDEIVRLASEGKWAIARDLHETVFSTQQANVDNRFHQIYLKVREDVQNSFLQATQVQNLTRLISITSVIAAFSLAIILGIATTRSIVIPVKKLTQAAQRVSMRDFSPFSPLPSQDEIGELSRSFALMTDWLKDSYESLETRVFERTQELERQNLQIQTAAKIAQEASSSDNIDEVLTRTVDLIVNRFGYYQAGIFLLDETKTNVILRSIAGPASGEMVSSKHLLKIGESSIVGKVALTGTPRVALEVEPDKSQYKDTQSPETQSEIALPMKVGDEIIGVLDVQRQSSNAFQDSDIYVLRILADLVSVTIHNAKLKDEVQESLNELEKLYGEYSHRSWNKHATQGAIHGYMYDHSGVHPIRDEQSGEYVSLHTDEPSINVPLTIRGGVIGTLIVYPGENLFSPDDINLIEDIGTRISQSMESARLFTETQRRASNERLVRQASSHMRETLDIESVLRTAVDDIYNTLNLSQVSIQLQPELGIGEKSNGKNIPGKA